MQNKLFGPILQIFHEIPAKFQCSRRPTIWTAQHLPMASKQTAGARTQLQMLNHLS